MRVELKLLNTTVSSQAQDPSGIVEKADLVAKVEAAAAAASSADGTAAVPPGYAFDPESKYYYSEQARMFYDAASGGYFSQARHKLI